MIENVNETDHDSQVKIFQTFYWLNSGMLKFFKRLLDNSEIFINIVLFFVKDRFYWRSFDPINLSEGLLAIANVITFGRLCFYLPISQQLGPLQITLGKMINVFEQFFIYIWLIFLGNRFLNKTNVVVVNLRTLSSSFVFFQ